MQKEIRGSSVAFKRAYYDKTKKRSYQAMLATVSLESYEVPLDLRHKFNEAELIEADDFLRSDEARDALTRHIKAKEARKKAPRRKSSKTKIVLEQVFEDGDAAYDAFQIALSALSRAIDGGYQPEYQAGVRGHLVGVLQALIYADLADFYSTADLDPASIAELKSKMDAPAIRDALMLPHKVINDIAYTWSMSKYTSSPVHEFESWRNAVAAGRLPMPKAAKEGWEAHCKRRIVGWVLNGVSPQNQHFSSPFMNAAHTEKLCEANDAARALDLHERQNYVPGAAKLADFDPFCFDGYEESKPVVVDPLAEARALVAWSATIYEQRNKYITALANGEWEPTLNPKQSLRYEVCYDYANWCKSQGFEVL